jgi:CDGSH iron-sulfur domain-containing protein 3
MSETTKITALDNGPFLVAGNIVLADGEGQPYPANGAQIALCRCGASTNQPFCNGTHAKIGFVAAQRAINPAQ